MQDCDAKMSSMGTPLTILESCLFSVIAMCLAIFFPLALTWIKTRYADLKAARNVPASGASNTKNGDCGCHHGVQVRDVGTGGVEVKDKEQDDEEKDETEENNLASQRSSNLQRLRLHASILQKQKELLFQLKEIRLNINSLEREKERAFELRKMELQNQRSEMGRRLENEGKAIELAHTRVLVDLKRVERKEEGIWTPSSPDSEYEVIGDEKEG